MDFIERLFGISPDHGNGLTELAFLLVFFLAAAIGYWLKVSRKRRNPF